MQDIRSTPPNGQPVGALCIIDTRPRGFDKNQRALLRDLAHWVETELGRNEHASDIDSARLIAEARTIPEVPGYTVAADASTHVGLSGDFYDLQRRCGTLRFTLVDAMGHGIGAALIAAGIRASLRTDPSRTLAQAMADADRVIADEFGELDIFATGVYGDLDLDTGVLEMVDAGHGLAFILCADGSWTPLRSKGLPLGLGTGKVAEREPIRATLAPGDTLVCCSDGLLDVLDPEDPFGQAARTIRERGAHGAVALVAELARDERATDDITAIVIQRDA